MTLTPKQQRFVAEFLVDLNATKAYIRAGYSAKGAQQSASRLLLNAVVQAAVTARQTVQLERADLKKERVLEEYRRIAFLDPRGFWEKVEERGVAGPVTVVRLKAIVDLDAEHAACLASFEAVIKNVAAGDGQTDLVHKIKFWSKIDALDALAAHFGIVGGIVEVRDLSAILTRARDRLAAERKRNPLRTAGR
jgi:phage terminase small subunit